MHVNVRFLCVDTPVGDIEVEEGATIEGVLRYCVEEYDIKMSLNKLLNYLFLVNKNPARPDFKLSEGDNLVIVRPPLGG